MKAATPADKRFTFSRSQALAFAALAAAAFALAFASVLTSGPVSHHMLAHIALMNFLGPSLAFFTISTVTNKTRTQAPMIWPATLAQLFLFLFWHASPGVADAAFAIAVMHASLAIAALWFWFEIMRWRKERPWTAVAALAVTGKIICLIAALYVFAPRALYGGALETALADQQLAGLFMLAACPLTYLGAAFLITVAAFDRQSARPVASGDAA